MSPLRPDQYEPPERDLDRSVSPLEASNLNNSVYDLVREQMMESSAMDGFQEQLDLRIASSDNPAAVMELDMDGNVRYLSKNWETIVGTNIKKIIHRPVSKIIIGVSDEDLKIFNNAIHHMVQDDGSYKVKFVTATNDRTTEPDSRGKITPTNSLNEMVDESALQIPESEGTKYDANDSDDNYPSSLSSQLSNNGDIIELEAQGILIHDPTTRLPSHSIWTIKPFIHVDVELTIPPKLSNMLGFGSEILEGYLSNLQELGIIDEDSVPQPKLVLCRICEQNIPAWFIERHSDLCLVEHRFSEELQTCHELVAEQRNLILRISDSLWIQLQGASLAVPSSSSSTSSLSLTSSTSSLINDYKGIRLPMPSSDNSSPKLTNQALPGIILNPSPLGGPVTNSRPRSTAHRRFPFGILQRLLDLCDEVMLINPADSDDSGQYQFSPNTREAMSQVERWKTIETTDPALRAMVEDTQQLASDKIETATRFLSMLQYSQKIKSEVDQLVLAVVHETVMRIREQTLENEKREPIMGMLKRENEKSVSPAAQESPQQDSLEVQKAQSLASPTIHSPQPARTLSPTYLVQGGNQQRSSVTPHDILLRTHSQHASASSILSQNVSPNNSGENIAEVFNDLDLSKKSTLSNSSSFCSPRRHLSPAPYLEKGSLSSLQKNTNSLPHTNPPSPLIEANHSGDSELLGTPTSSNSNEKRKSESSGINNLHLNLNPRMASMKPPLSPLLVSLTPTGKSSSGQIKDYEVLKAISKGAFGSVFLAKRKLTGDYVAIKCLKKRDMIAKNQVLNVRSERAVMMKQADSPYVAQLYSSFQTKDYLYLVMEYLNGGDCATLLKMLGTLGNEWARRYIAEVVVGVNDLHERGIIHRDLKPDNLLIDSKGHLKLTDFGLSQMGVVGRMTRSHRKSSTSEQGIELFRRSLQQGNQSPLANLVGLGLGSDDSPGSAQSTPNESSSGNHKRVSSVTPFSLSPALDASRDSKSFPNTSEGGFRPRRGRSASRSGSITGLDSPLVRPSTHKEGSDMSFPFDDDDYGSSPSTNIAPPTSYALYDPTEDKELKHFVGTPDYLAPETIEGIGQSEASDWWSLGCILFEFIYGYPPFHADTPDEVFKRILGCNIDWPPLSPEEDREVCPPSAKDLIVQLLTLDPEKRLGSNGAQEIKNHPYFRGINWDTLFEEIPSFIPNVEDPESTDYFDSRGADISHFPKDEDEDNGEYYHGQNQLSPPLSAPLAEPFGSSIAGSGSRERRSSKLADPSEFGSFHFRNLSVLEKANKDVINRLKSEHLEHRGSFSSSSSDSTPLGRPRGLSITNTSGGSSGSPFKRPLSPGAFLAQRVPSPLKTDQSPATTPSSQNFKHERMGSAVSAYSSGDEYPFDSLKTSVIPSDKAKAGHRHSLTKQVFTKSVSEFSPSSSDTEDSISSALLRVRKRRESSRKPSATGSLFSRNSSSEIRAREIDVLYCEPIPIVRHTISKFLEEVGCIVVSVSDGDELIRRATSQVKFDIIFTALKIPKVDAIDAVKLIKYTSGVNSNTPIVAITGYAKDAHQSGMFAEVLEKPLDRGQLRLAIYRLSVDANAIESDREEDAEKVGAE